MTRSGRLDRVVRALALAAPGLVGGVFLAGAVLKAVTPGPAADAIGGFGVSPEHAMVAVGMLVAMEGALGVWLALAPGSHAARVVAVGSLVVLSGGLGWMVTHRAPTGCGCLGSLSAMPPDWGGVAFNIALIGALVLSWSVDASAGGRVGVVVRAAGETGGRTAR